MLLAEELELTANSYYEASVTRPPVCASLIGQIRADVCVVGGGYAGLSAALELAARGYAVVLLEAQCVGWGASGRNGGQVIVGFEGEDAVEDQLPDADARRAWDISVEGLRLLRERIAKYAIQCDYVPGYLMAAVNARKSHRLHAWVDHVGHVYDYPVQAIVAADMHDWIASERFHGGAYDPGSGHLHPLKYCLGLAAAARAAGVRVYEHAAVHHVERGAQPVVETATGEVACRFVVLAGSVYLGEYGTRWHRKSRDASCPWALISSPPSP